jgi:hypothetical protein
MAARFRTLPSLPAAADGQTGHRGLPADSEAHAAAAPGDEGPICGASQRPTGSVVPHSTWRVVPDLQEDASSIRTTPGKSPSAPKDGASPLDSNSVWLVWHYEGDSTLTSMMEVGALWCWLGPALWALLRNGLLSVRMHVWVPQRPRRASVPVDESPEGVHTYKLLPALVPQLCGILCHRSCSLLPGLARAVCRSVISPTTWRPAFSAASCACPRGCAASW